MRIRGTWFRPASLVVLDSASARAASRIVSRYAEMSDRALRGDEGDDAIVLLRLWWKARLEWGHAGGQVAIEVNRPGIEQPAFVLFEPVSERPFWWDELTGTDEAYEDYHRHHERPIDVTEVASEDFSSHGFEEEEDAEVRADSATTALQQAARLAQEEIDAEAEDTRYAAKIAELRMKILAQADGDLIELVVPPPDEEQREEQEAWGRKVHAAERVLHVPRAPFMHWALSRGIKGVAPDWEIVSPHGMKCQGDNPYHTDWMIGAGLDLRDDYYVTSPASKAAWDLAFRITTSIGDYNAMVLSIGNEKPVTGVVGVDVLVLENLHPSQADAVMKSKAVVTETGGALAHLARVSAEFGIPMLLVKDARKAFPPGTKLLVDPDGYVINLSASR
jgi:phosphohistidine swiveling domain-containing protein